MPTIQVSPAVTVDLVFKKNDLVSFPFSVLDDSSNPVNFSGFTAAKMTIRNYDYLEIISFTSTGATYQIDITNRNIGAFTIKCNSLTITADEYLYDFQVSNATQVQTIMQGKIILTDDITLR